MRPWRTISRLVPGSAQPRKSYSGRVMFRVSPEVHGKAAQAAELAGKSLNQWAEEVLDRAAQQGAARLRPIQAAVESSPQRLARAAPFLPPG